MCSTCRATRARRPARCSSATCESSFLHTASSPMQRFRKRSCSPSSAAPFALRKGTATHPWSSTWRGFIQKLRSLHSASRSRAPSRKVSPTATRRRTRPHGAKAAKLLSAMRTRPSPPRRSNPTATRLATPKREAKAAKLLSEARPRQPPQRRSTTPCNRRRTSPPRCPM